MRLRYLLPLGIFFGMVVLFAMGLQNDPRLVPSPLIDKPAPAFSLPLVHDGEAYLGSGIFKGQVSLFNVWASWCVACRSEHPFLMELARSGRIPVYGLNYKDRREDALRWLAQFGDPYKSSGFDEAGRVGIDWGVYGVPETFLVDKQGLIRYKQIGPLTREDWRTTLLPLIEQLEAEAS